MLFKLTNIEKTYGGYEVLKDVSFQINPGEKVGLVGRNGAGKTTLFKIITGEVSADTGDVQKINGLSIGLLAQHIDFETEETVHTAALTANKRLHDLESEMHELEHKMAEDHSSEILERYSEIQAEFEREGGFEFTAKAEAILLGIGFPKETWELSTAVLSGGQKNRLGMARLLLSESDIFLLDEPTNHLDVDAVEWLEDYLVNSENAYVAISHDRYFLDRTCAKIVEIENGKAYTYKGNYSYYVEESMLQKEQRKREYENQQAYISKTQAFIRKNLAGQKTKQAKSRRNMLARMDKLERVDTEVKTGNFNLGEVQRTGSNVLSIEDVSIGYPGKMLVSGIDLLLHRGDCLGVIGANGTGKTTFLRTIQGKLRELSGEIKWGTKVTIGYYSQQLEELDAANTLLDEIRKISPNAENGVLRSYLAGFLFFGDDVFKQVRDLSGGEKGRLSLAKLIYSKANVLILDEPTNHLDIPSREALEAALEQYEGTIITVSHDRYFLDRISTQILFFNEDKTAKVSLGNYTEFFSRNSKTQQEDFLTIPMPVHSAPKPIFTRSKNEVKRVENKIAEIERKIEAFEEKQTDLTQEMNQPANATDSEKLAQLGAEYDRLSNEISHLETEWTKLGEELESTIIG
ncbi:MAG: ABC-F family ATP-binding cassette domain-containing protein [Pyrinomonadaceae bacterium]